MVFILGNSSCKQSHRITVAFRDSFKEIHIELMTDQTYSTEKGFGKTVQYFTVFASVIC